MKPYPQELRERVAAAVEQGEHSISEVAHLFSVGVTFVKKMWRLYREGEDLAPRHGGGGTPSLQEPELQLLREQVEKQPDISLNELRAVLVKEQAVSVSQATVSRALQALNLPRKKKSFFAQERDEKRRAAFRRLTAKVAPEQCVFVDEMGSHLSMTRLYARAAPGARITETLPADHHGNLSTIGAVGLTGMRTALSVPGAIDTETMIFFVEEMLAPTLCPGELVFLDNCLIHKADEIEEAIERRGAWAIFLPTYSPDFNPIENCWSKVKSVLRSLKPRTREELLEALTKAFAKITALDIQGWFRHCGYRVARTCKSL